MVVLQLGSVAGVTTARESVRCPTESLGGAGQRDRRVAPPDTPPVERPRLGQALATVGGLQRIGEPHATPRVHQF